jgi:DNA repair protein RadC
MTESQVLARVRRRGYGSAFAPDLLAIGAARREEDIDSGEEAAKRFLLAGQRLQALSSLSADMLREHFGLDGFESGRVLALLELGRRVGIAGKGPVRTIMTAEDVAELLEHLTNSKQEHFVALLLDTRSNLIREAEIHVGTLNQSLVGPREVFREAIREGASSLVVAHNHPSGDPEPSLEDIEITRKLAEVGRLLDIPLVDHVILGDRRWTSLRTRGVL